MSTNFNISRYNKIEFRLVTIFFIMLGLRLVKVIENLAYFAGIQEHVPIEKLADYNYMDNYLLPWVIRLVSLYGCYVLLHFVIIKNLVNRVSIIKYSTLSFVLLAALIIIYHRTEIALYSMRFLDIKDKEVVAGRLFYDSFGSIISITVWYALYTYLKYNPLVVGLINKIKPKPYFILSDCLLALIIWGILFYYLNAPNSGDDYPIALILALPAIGEYAYASLILIPFVKRKNKGFGRYWLLFLLIMVGILFLISVFFLLLIGRTNILEELYVMTLGVIGIHQFIVVPLCWFIYQSRSKLSTEITELKTALGQSTANLDFLRSQINPHFLFNALNTLYGTALQENADRTGTGIQKLGDMMRFMLQENVQEKISLTREIDYLNNYIDLQKLRTQITPDIVIELQIDGEADGLQIAPMLLIPFVENAFKHGISLREPSHIKIVLNIRDNELLFDVTNSIHTKTGIDPEKDKSGIGLENVKQRLQLLYPDQHSLTIRENEKEFFIYLTLTLN